MLKRSRRTPLPSFREVPALEGPRTVKLCAVFKPCGLLMKVGSPVIKYTAIDNLNLHVLADMSQNI